VKAYDASFTAGSQVRIVDRRALERFLAEWRYHNRLAPEQLAFAGKVAKVGQVGFYHGGAPLYVLEDVPGVWHEECLEACEEVARPQRPRNRTDRCSHDQAPGNTRGDRSHAMIVGAHSIIYSMNPEADRAFFRDVLELPSVDVGDGWLIFGLPPAEVAVHPSAKNDAHELYLICDDIDGFVGEMAAHGVTCGPVETLSWGRLTRLRLPGGGALGVYQPCHARPKPMRAPRAAKARGGA
jgi:hypothetical protein